MLAIVAISAALLVPNLFPDPRELLRRDAQRLADTLQHAALAAQWRGENLAWSAEGSRYYFWQLDAAAPQAPSDEQGPHPGWHPMADDDVLADHGLSAGEYAELLRLGSQPVSESWLVFRADGLNEPYAIEMGNSAARFIVSADPLNRLSLDELPR